MVGDVWTWTAMDTDSKLIISWRIGGRNADMASQLIADLEGRLANRVELTTDGHRAYLLAVENAFCPKIDYGLLVKFYGNDHESETLYSPAITNAVSKKVQNHAAMLALYFFYYNFCRVHQTLRVTPAMKALISDHVWTIEEMVSVLRAKEIDIQRSGVPN
jgi:hypothetical protein